MNLSKDLRKFREECDNGSSYWFSDDHRDRGIAFKGQNVTAVTVVTAVIATIAHLDGTERPYEVQYPAVLPGKPSDAGIRSHSGDRDDINNLAQ